MIVITLWGAWSVVPNTLSVTSNQASVILKKQVQASEYKPVWQASDKRVWEKWKLGKAWKFTKCLSWNQGIGRVKPWIEKSK